MKYQKVIHENYKGHRGWMEILDAQKLNSRGSLR